MTNDASTQNSVIQDDLTELMEVLGIPTHARPISPHEVFQGEVLPRVRLLVAVVDAARGITDPNWTEADTLKKSEERLRRAMWELDGGR